MAAERRPVLFAGAAGAAGWAILLAGTALFGSVGVVATKVGVIFGLPGVAFIALALLFPALLAGSAAGHVVAPHLVEHRLRLRHESGAA